MTVTVAERVDASLDRLLTRYRESRKFKALLSVYLTEIAEAGARFDAIAGAFDIDDAPGELLSVIGRQLGWPRTHCVCSTDTVFGFECEGVPELQPIVGFCHDDYSSWAGCSISTGEIEISDDDIYRAMLKCRVRQVRGDFNLESLNYCIRELFGPTARVVHTGQFTVTVAPGRELSVVEQEMLQVYPRVLPVAMGVRLMFHFDNAPVFGFGEGWGGFCDVAGDDSPWLCPVEINVYDCA